ncbi:RHS repeat-associated core domain-containing protein [Curtobacterium sp. MWU13-2055]|uniref:RHS repeat-associated core domain-containing protein n=2 Tax=unclassified Curtobacterium TaxID=257496 RepID=UPI00200F7D94|nr:RHS repeat-associated core domain-containing protein [Curtobacterium sp. MWU13-2055]
MTLVALLGSLLVVVSQPAPAQAVVTGTGGQYVPMPSNARVLGGATEKGVFRTVKVAGVAGLPSSGIGAVTMMVTIADPSGSGQLQMRADDADTTTLMMIYNSGVGGNTSNTGLLAVADDGTIQARTETAQSKVVIDITGYYTSTKNGVSAGGFVAMSPSRVLDSRGGIGAAQGQIPAGSQRTIQATGSNGIPTGAAAVAVNIIVINREAKAGYVRPTPTGETRSTGVLNYNSVEGQSTAMNAQVALNADGKFSIDTAEGGGKIDLVVDIQGYFLQSNPGGGFTPLNGRLIDTRNGASIAPGASFTVQVGGVQGAPTVEGGLSAAAVTFTAVNDSGADSYAKMWADGAAEPESSAISSDRTSKMTNTVVAPVGANGKIRIKNMGTAAMNYLVDLQGAYNSLPGGPGNTNRTGQRTSATTLPFPITDQTNASVDVGTGNLLVTTTAMSLPGVTQNTTIGAAYNSRSTTVGDANTMDANRWQFALAGAGDLTANAQGVIYTDAVGTAWQFRPSGAQGAFISPAGLQQTLTRVTPSGQDTQYQLKGWTTNQTTVFNLAGQPTKVTDRNGNIIDFTFATSDRYKLTSLVSTAGVTGARTANSSYASGVQTFSQTSGSSSRSVSWTKNSTGDITTYTDALGKKTTFGYTSGDLTTITAPEGGVTAFTYDSSDRITKVEQRNTTAGSPGTAVTRFSFKDDTTTLVADPRSDQSVAVADAKRTTYTLDGNDLVTKAVDPADRERGREYNPANNGVTTATTGTGDTTSTSTNDYGKNESQSLTKSTSSSGSSSSATYDAPGAANKYLPSSTTDSAGDSTSYEYSGVGNPTSTSTGGTADAAKAELDYNSDGTVKTATAPGNGGNPTKYEYENKQLKKVTAPNNPSSNTDIVGAKEYTYDGFGRMRTETDGRGNTTTYGYDNDDRTTSIAFSDGTATVTRSYDGNGNLLTETSATGTITNTYDQRNRLTSTVNTAGGGTVSYGYDLAGNTVTVTDAQGQVTHEYDPSNVLTATTYPTNTGTAKQVYLTDDHGRRTDTWLGAPSNATPGAEPASWTGHQQVEYDASGKITHIKAWTGKDAALEVNTKYCYQFEAPSDGTCDDSDKSKDRSKLQWTRDGSGQATKYGYTSGRLTKITQSGGDTPTNWAFTYDKAGNRTRATATNATIEATVSDQQLSYNALGQITTTGYAYDKTGNMTASPGATYTYNGAQQMTSSTKDGKTTTYEYAGADMNKLLYQATDGGAEYGYTYGTSDSNGVPVIASRELVGTGTAAVISDPTTGQLLDLRTTDGTTSMYVLDGIGNPVASLKDTGAVAYKVTYDAYGKEQVNADGGSSAQWQQNPYGYKAGIRASNTDTGLTKFGYRWQSAATGSWIERDTLDAPLSPSNANRYAYAGADPINKSDPRGRDVFDSATDAFGKAGLVGNLANIGYYAATGNSKAAATETVGLITGTLAGAACELGIAAATGGVGVIATAGCYAVGTAVSNVTTGKVF